MSKLHLMPQTERIRHNCFICGSFPTKYRANVQRQSMLSDEPIVFHHVAICNKCALSRSDMLVDDETEL